MSNEHILIGVAGFFFFAWICQVIVYYLDKRQAAKREQDLFNRLMARSLDEYSANSVRMSAVKPEYIGEVSKPVKEEDIVYPVD